MTHLQKYHQENLGHLGIYNKVVPKPFRAHLNKNNIGKPGLNTGFEFGQQYECTNVSHWSIANVKKYC